MRAHLVEIIFAVLSIIYLALYARGRFGQGASTQPARKAWLRTGVIFGVISLVLFYLHR